MKAILGAAVALLLAIPAAASAAVVPVTSLTGNFAATNPSVALGPDGVTFGPYANGGFCDEGGNCSVGSVLYTGANGLTLADITALAFTETHNSTDNSPIAAPYLRVFTTTNGVDEHSVIFDSTECASTSLPENEPNHQDVIAGTPSGVVRYDDDACVPDPDLQTWQQVVADHGTDVITGIYITTGATGGIDLSALVSDLTVNGTTFDFGAPQAGPAGSTVTIVQQPTQLTQTTVASSRLVGNTLRVLHAPKRKGERLVSVRALLLTPTGPKRLPVDGRAIKVDLRRKPVGNYNVILKSKYRRKDGTVHTVRTTRNLSITPAA